MRNTRFRPVIDRSLEVFDERRKAYQNLSLFPEDRPLPADAVNSIQVRLSGLRLLVVNRLLEPGSEFRVHRHWFDRTAMAELL